MADRDFHLENVRVAIQIGIISIPEGIEAMRAIKTGDNRIIKELYKERQNGKTLDI